jgi:hypothetical protein
MLLSLENVRHQFSVSTDHLPAGFTSSAVAEVVDARREVLSPPINQGIKRLQTAVSVDRPER